MICLPLTPEAINNPSWNYRAVDWQQFNSTLGKELKKIDPPQIIASKEDFQKAVKQLDETLRRTIELAVPKTRPHLHQKHWWTKELTTLVNELKKHRKQAYKFCAILDHPSHVALAEKVKLVDKTIRATKEDHWKEWLENASGNDLWTANMYIVNPGGDGERMCILTLKGKDQEGRDVLAATNKEKSTLLACTLFPKMTYAASVWFQPIYNASSITTVRGSKGIATRMSQVQRTAALAITGTMRTAPTDSIETHANLLPIPLLMQCILLSSTLRMASLPICHPLHTLVSRAAKRNIKRHRTALHRLLHGLAVNPEKTEIILPQPVHPTALTPFLTQIAALKDNAKAEFSRCQSRTMVFMDSSCHDGKVGAAAALFIDHKHITTLRHHLLIRKSRTGR